MIKNNNSGQLVMIRMMLILRWRERLKSLTTPKRAIMIVTQDLPTMTKLINDFIINLIMSAI